MNIRMNPEEVLKNSGYKLTQQRRAIIEVLRNSGGPYTANEILSLVSDKYSGINFSTIYRNLELLVRLGIVEKLNIADGYCHFKLTGENHHHHIICNKCGEIREIDICPFDELLRNTKLEDLDFEPVEHKFEIYGICSKCKDKK
ncbi:Fur family transcriptional regulator [Lutispora thermophila]|uniref:Fur family transcriptional regulator, zinc uptake regulator n=1 Tax=Lutispora thermophila DSM 19022 TaxID=1122184 RepID=A0A1M6IMG3_9FIRM|nr:Fur family transcriptional regulator [Lutispora thermophila]SHJ35624.1 Fur family transcriptional regulator, zinc uptake regulator [Lutispora thermophila DSM 19022]